MKALCPICQGADQIVLDRREKAPVLMHRTFDSAEAARACQTAGIELRRCTHCGFAWNAAFEPEKIVYGPDYDNAQGYSAEFRAHIDARIDAIFAATTPDDRLVIVEVGSGQGDFLARVMARYGARVRAAFGFDPAWRGKDGEGPAGTRLYRRFFDATASATLADFAPDIVISRHTIEHIAEPMLFLTAIRAGIGARDGVRLFLETPDIEWIIRHQAFEDVFCEHCSIFDSPSMRYALEAAGFSRVETSLCFGEQYLWTSAVSKTGTGNVARPVPASATALAGSTPGIGTEALVREWVARIDRIRAGGGSFAVWGAGAKGMTFAQFIDPDQQRIVAIIDVNPGKQGRYIGMSGHKVVSPAAIPALGITDSLVMNPNYLDEIRRTLQEQGVEVTLHSLREDKA